MALADYKDVVHRCFRCGYCKLTEDYSQFNCPAYYRFRFESYAPGGMLWLIKAWLAKEIDWTASLAEIVYSCTACNSCVAHCKFEFNEDVLNMILAAREEMVENGLVLPRAARFFRNLEATGNPFRELPRYRGRWAEGKGISRFERQEYLYYVGCMASYDERGQEAARSFADLLTKAGASFGILGPDEVCDGNEVNMLGEKRVFDMLAEKNGEMFRALGVRKLVALSPHSYNAFRNLYTGSYEVLHYTHVIRDLVREGKLDVSRGLDAKVTYHDPCFLGRHNGEYEAPRDILRAIPGIQMVEMERNRDNAFCCGGGSGNFYIDSFGGGELSPARARVREAYETGASILAVACPICMSMFTDAVKSEGLEESMAVRDIGEIVRETL